MVAIVKVDIEEQLINILQNESGCFCVIKYSSNDYIAVLEKENIKIHAINSIELDNVTIPIVQVEKGKYPPFKERILVSNKDASDELLALAALADLYLGINR
ncbi:hypothetical protein [Bacillus sp. XF8]|uniref:hypothetical protein n=1 Tax=Bacillus sp. XF8 TaxID=2819289 RepID=UPI001AA0635F|nr:hypothetical protein [Bacillus sp. XF8]MBO1582102.1 hypothetical protein [Bacillus sp. XF8]